MLCPPMVNDFVTLDVCCANVSRTAQSLEAGITWYKYRSRLFDLIDPRVIGSVGELAEVIAVRFMTNTVPLRR